MFLCQLFRCQASCVAVSTAIAMMLQKKPEDEDELESLIKRSCDYAKETLKELNAEVSHALMARRQNGLSVFLNSNLFDHFAF